MQLVGNTPNVAKFVCILKVCGHALVVSKGQEMDVVITKKRLLEFVIVGIT